MCTAGRRHSARLISLPQSWVLTWQLERHSNKSRQELKALAKKNDVKSARILAKELVRANKQRDRLVSAKARLSSVQMQLQHQLCESLLSWFAPARGAAWVMLTCSDGESHWRVPKEHRDHEIDKSAGQAASAERDHAGDVNGDDESGIIRPSTSLS